MNRLMPVAVFACGPTAQVIDVDPYRKVNEFSDLSNVAKYEMPDDEYSKRQGGQRESQRKPSVTTRTDARLELLCAALDVRFGPRLYAA